MRFWPRDLPLFWMTFIIMLLGLVTLYSVSSVHGIDQYQDSLFFLRRQLLFASVGFSLMIGTAHFSPKTILKLSPYLVAVTGLCLLLLLVPGIGHGAKGGMRWFNFGGVRFQPSEFAKIALVAFFAKTLTDSKQVFQDWKKNLVKPIAIALLFAALLLKQPDFGNTVIVILAIFSLAFLAGAPWKSFLWAGGISGLGLGFIMIAQPYRVQRLVSFLDPWRDPQNASYQIIQSFIAFNRGSIFGVGLGNSQSKLYFLPEVKTDFIASVFAEELGLVGFTSLLCLYALMILRGFRIAQRAKDDSEYLLAAGATLLLGFQAVFNLMVVLSLLPTKGLPLPFVSMGGSSLLSSMILCGLIQSVAGASQPHTT